MLLVRYQVVPTLIFPLVLSLVQQIHDGVDRVTTGDVWRHPLPFLHSSVEVDADLWSRPLEQQQLKPSEAQQICDYRDGTQWSWHF